MCSKLKLFPYCCVAILLVSAKPSFAATDPQAKTLECSGNIQITEFAPNASSPSKDWVEIYNNSDTEINLSGYSIAGRESSRYSPTVLTAPIAPKSYMSLDMSNGSVLVSSGEKENPAIVRILDPTKKVVCSVSYENSKSGSSIALINSQWVFATPSKGTENKAEDAPPAVEENTNEDTNSNEETTAEEKDEEDNTQKEYPKNIFITRIYPCPNKDEKEWVELINKGEEDADLESWKIDDGKDTGSDPITFSSFIKKDGTVKVELTKNILNNDGDVVRLLTPDGSEVDNTSFENCEVGVAIAKGQEQEINTKTLTTKEPSVKGSTAPTAKLNVGQSSSNPEVKAYQTKTVDFANVEKEGEQKNKFPLTDIIFSAVIVIATGAFFFRKWKRNKEQQPSIENL